MKDRLILEFPNFIPPDKVEWLKTSMRSSMQFDIGDCANREGHTVLLTTNMEKSEGLKQVDTYLLKVFSTLAEKIADTFKPISATADSGYEYHLYPPGSICKAHADGEFILGENKYYPGVQHTASLVRYATAVIYLTTNNGGELVFPATNTQVKPEAGKAVVFPPYGAYQHHANAAEEDREIIMTWFVYNNVNAVLT